MKNKKVILCAVLLLGLGLTGLHAQTALTATGSNASGSGGSVSYSLGQVVYTTNTGINGTMAQGVQQPYEISIITALEEAEDISLFVSAYPNPAADYLTLEVNASAMLNIQSMAFQLYDMQGKLLQSEKITGNHTSIDMSNRATATYFVTVVQGNKEVKTFKIIKN